MSQFLDRATLENSNVVANCIMNRERKLLDENSYYQELGFNILEFLQARLQEKKSVVWLDLCCGTGRALIEAAEYFEILRKYDGEKSDRATPATRTKL